MGEMLATKEGLRSQEAVSTVDGDDKPEGGR
jgi:hypothetical protein